MWKAQKKLMILYRSSRPDFLEELEELLSDVTQLTSEDSRIKSIFDARPGLTFTNGKTGRNNNDDWWKNHRNIIIIEFQVKDSNTILKASASYGINNWTSDMIQSINTAIVEAVNMDYKILKYVFNNSELLEILLQGDMFQNLMKISELNQTTREFLEEHQEDKFNKLREQYSSL